MILEEGNDNYCRIAATQVGHSNSKFTIGKKGLLIRNFPLKAEKIILSLSSCQRILHLFHYHPIARLLGRRQTYNTFRHIITVPTWRMTYIRLSYNSKVATKTVTSTAASDHYNCSLPPVHSTLLQWTSPVPCQRYHKVISMSCFRPSDTRN